MGTATALVLALVASAEVCPDRACLVAAAGSCRAATGTLALSDWLALPPEMTAGVSGTTTVTVLPGGAAGACSMVLKQHIDKAAPHEPRQGLSGDKALTGQQVAELMNANVRAEVQCDAPAAKLAALLGKLGEKGIKLWDFEPCYPTRCEPLPPLDEGCTATGPCAKGGYDVVCGALKCKMSGIATRDLSLDVVYRCVENGVGMRTRAATAPTGATSLQGKTLVLVSTSAELKEAVTAAAMKEGGKVVDATVLFVALFGAIKEGGAGGARAKVGPGDFSVKLPQTVPSEALADFDRGLSACKKKWKKPLSNEPCAQELVNAVWQRHLLRVGADLVLLLSPMTVSGAVGAEATVYAPASTSVSSSSPLAGDLKSLASMLVTRGLDTSFGTMPRKVYPTIPGDR